MVGGGPDSSWADLGDVLVWRAVLVARAARGRPPDPLAGLKVDDSDLSALLGELPGSEEADRRAGELEEATAEAAEAAVKAFADSLDGDGSFARLARRARLELDAAAVLAVLCSVEADPQLQRLVGYLNDDVTARRPNLWTLRLICGDLDGGAAVAPGGPLRRACLLEEVAEGPWSSAPIAVAPPVLWWLHGAAGTESGVPAGTRWVVAEGGRVRTVAVPPQEVACGPAGVVAVAAGPDRIRRLQALAEALAPASLLLVVAGEPSAPAGWESVVRQATLHGAAVVVEVDDELASGSADTIEAAGHLAWGLSSRRELPVATLPRGWVSARVQPPAATGVEWEEAFGPLEEPPLPLTAEQVDLAGRAAAALGGDVAAAVRRLAAGHIDATATRIRPVRGWDDLVLDSDREELVRSVAVRCRQKRTVFGSWGFSGSPSTGVVALFAGPSGTGKTLAAEVVAGELGVDLYAVDLANLVSKYIGETEKNLARVFDAAEASNVALFFDEADALLGRRSAVSDAHDRYANIEVAYLLQRLERYEGLAVLATNLVNNIDPAFVRRLHVVVEFPVPGPAERRGIWRRCLPGKAPLGEDLDLDELADRFEMTGGTIRNAALAAAFVAAEAGSPITMAVALKGVQMELRKIGRLVSDADMLSGGGRN
ncbi:MAG TPA: ATP-binding protein [Acidimicrobiales bacterium]|nr:ATP-binding protein [Acidimicrobiales bacterium]